MATMPTASIDTNDSSDHAPAADLQSSSKCLPKTSGRKRKQISYDEDIENEPASPATPHKKSKQSPKSKSSSTPKTKSKTATKASAPSPEKRLRRFRAHPPQSYLIIKERALTQRLTVLSRTRTDTPEHPEEKISIAGSTGNVYTVHITQVPSCDCPHAQKGNQCKHIIYAMHRVLKSPDHLSYQLSLTPSELSSIITSAPPIPTSTTISSSSPSSLITSAINSNSIRKPITPDTDCPICYTPFSETAEDEKEPPTFCSASCGNNVHRSCMRSWAAACKGKPTCPYCRSPWAEDISGGIGNGDLDLEGAERGEEGYVNVAGRLGLSRERDYSSYHSYWVRRQRSGWF